MENSIIFLRLPFNNEAIHFFIYKDMAVKFGAKIVDGFDVDTIEQEGEIVTIKNKNNVTYSAPSLGMNN